MESLIYPGYLRIIIRKSDGWHFVKEKPFANPFNFPTFAQKDLFYLCGLTMKEVASELRKINNAAHGYYIANILDKKYYYCGSSWEDLRRTLREELGIGVKDPLI